MYDDLTTTVAVPLFTAGGGYAYYKKGSTASLQSSLSVAAALFASAWLLGVNPAIGTALGLSAFTCHAAARDMFASCFLVVTHRFEVLLSQGRGW